MLKNRPRKGFPTKIRVLDREYKVRYWTEDTDFGDSPSWGEYDYDEGVINILDKGQSRIDISSILWHEILHAVIQGLNIRTILDASDEEDTVTSLATGITSVLVDLKESFWPRPQHEKKATRGTRKRQ